MDAAAELGRNPVHQIQPDAGRRTWDGTVEPVSRDQILRRERGQGTSHFPCSADQEQDWQPNPVCSILLLYVWPYITREQLRATVIL